MVLQSKCNFFCGHPVQILILEKGCDVNYNGTIVVWSEADDSWESGVTPIMLALSTYSLNAAQVLINQPDIGRYIE